MANRWTQPIVELAHMHAV